jgi:hypothetical protein
MALSLPIGSGVNTKPLRTRKRIETASSPIKAPTRSVVLWSPAVVLSNTVPGITSPKVLGSAEPALRPQAAKPRLEATRSILTTFNEARGALGTRAADAQALARHATSERDRVTAAMETYRVEAALDTLLTGTFRQITALMEERGLR